MQGFGEGVTRVAGLLHVQRHVDGLHGVPPLAVHLPAREFLLEAVLLDSEQKGGKGQNCGKKDEFGNYLPETSVICYVVEVGICGCRSCNLFHS